MHTQVDRYENKVFGKDINLFGPALQPRMTGLHQRRVKKRIKDVDRCQAFLV